MKDYDPNVMRDVMCPLEAARTMAPEELPPVPERMRARLAGMSPQAALAWRRDLALWGEEITTLYFDMGPKVRKFEKEQKEKMAAEEKFGTLTGWVETRTPRAMLFRSDNMEKAVWIPLSQILREEELGGDINRVEIDVREWILSKNGIE